MKTGFSMTYTAVDAGAGGVSYVCEDWYDCSTFSYFCWDDTVAEMCAATCGRC